MKQKFMLALAVIGLGFASCEKDDGPKIVETPIYGMQVNGPATGDKVFTIDEAQIVEPSSDFDVKAARNGMNYGIYFLKAGEMNFSNVLADEKVEFGVKLDSTAVQTAETGHEFSFDALTLTPGGTDAYTVKADGLYYIMTDETSSRAWVMKINTFEINATGDEATYVSGSADGASFEIKGVELRSVFKVRMNSAWKFVLPGLPWTDLAAGGVDGDHCRPVISYGGSVDALTADGGDISIETDKLLDMTFKWNPAEKGMKGITLEYAEGGDLPPPAFPENLYMTGAALGNGEWDWATNGLELTPVHSNPHLFFSVQWIAIGDDVGFKFSPELDWGKDFGVGAETSTSGVFEKGTGNVTVATAGYYTIVVNLKDETIEINEPMIYGIGDAFGGWDAAQAANMFTVDNDAEVITSPALSADADVRMHVGAQTMTVEDGSGPVDWWQAEFNVIDGKIEYRGTGDDQTAVPGTAGQVVTLNFKDGTGTIQ
jgi:hypothetical protein